MAVPLHLYPYFGRYLLCESGHVYFLSSTFHLDARVSLIGVLANHPALEQQCVFAQRSSTGSADVEALAASTAGRS